MTYKSLALISYSPQSRAVTTLCNCGKHRNRTYQPRRVILVGYQPALSTFRDSQYDFRVSAVANVQHSAPFLWFLKYEPSFYMANPFGSLATTRTQNTENQNLVPHHLATGLYRRLLLHGRRAVSFYSHYRLFIEFADTDQSQRFGHANPKCFDITILCAQNCCNVNRGTLMIATGRGNGI